MFYLAFSLNLSQDSFSLVPASIYMPNTELYQRRMSVLGSSVTNGIQDISALLPLLGTEQCERHLGSALIGGYLYAAFTSLSIFGSLGAVKIAFSVLFASIAVCSGSSARKFISAASLHDAGFRPQGDAASLIGLDNKSGLSQRYVAKPMLLKMLETRHIDDVEKLTVGRGKDGLHWNLCVSLYSLISSAFAVTPYNYLIRHTKGGSSTFPLWAFPVIRALGPSSINYLCRSSFRSDCWISFAVG
jgi:hypothetical protein